MDKKDLMLLIDWLVEGNSPEDLAEMLIEASSGPQVAEMLKEAKETNND